MRNSVTSANKKGYYLFIFIQIKFLTLRWIQLRTLHCDYKTFDEINDKIQNLDFHSPTCLYAALENSRTGPAFQ